MNVRHICKVCNGKSAPPPRLTVLEKIADTSIGVFVFGLAAVGALLIFRMLLIELS